MNAVSCHIVGDCLSKTQAKNIVIIGDAELKDIALVTGILWIPSTQNIFDRPKINKPLKARSQNELREKPSEIPGCSIEAIKNTTGIVIRYLPKSKFSVAEILLTFC